MFILLRSPLKDSSESDRFAMCLILADQITSLFPLNVP